MTSDSNAPLTSEQQMNMFRLRDKLCLLNSNFLQVFQGFYSEKAHYDFTGTMESYIEHVKQLRVMYNSNVSEMNTKSSTILKKDTPKKKCAEPVVTQNEVPSKEAAVIRKIAKATRRKSEKPKLTDDFAVSSPTTRVAPPEFGDISVISKDSVVRAPEEPTAPAVGARKRAIRGGGPLGGSESVIFKDGATESGNSVSVTKIPATNIKFPEPSKDFWTKKPEKTENAGNLFAFLGNNSETSTPKFSGFSFGKKNEEKTENKSDSLSKEEKDKKGEETPSKPLSFPSFASKKDPEDKKSTGLTFPSFGNSKDSKPSTIAFPSFGTEEKKLSEPATSGFTFGSNSNNGLSFGSGTSLFANITQKAAENSAKADGENNDDEGEYVPPKVEAVENDEPDAVLSSKVSVFKYVGKEYKKLGIGMLYVKKTDEKSSVLIRAATTTGTVWLNSLCNAAMKATKADDKGDKIRLTCPLSASEMVTMLIRFGTPEAARKFHDQIDEESKK